MPDQLTRRTALTVAAGAGVGLPLLAACGSSTTGASDPQTPVTQPTTSSASASPTAPATHGSPGGGAKSASHGAELGPTSKVPSGGGEIFAGQNVVVTQPTSGTFKGFSATCTHMGCQVSTVSNGTINCPCHGSQYSIKDGSVVAGPAPKPLPPVDIVVDGGAVFMA
jgi:Rieske Fe-S protein